jgi:phospholipase A-2-activating protein
MDRTARVWANGQCRYHLKGHQAAVWDIVALDESNVLTGNPAVTDSPLASADKTIKHWIQGDCIRTLTGHTDVVRSLAVLPEDRFVSCSNDASLRIWTNKGECLSVLYGHTSFVYQVSVLPTREIVSCGEDRTLKVWKENACYQTIVHPCTSLWAVSTMYNGDVCTGGSDGIVRIFSRDPSRRANESELQIFDKAVADFAIPAQQVGDVDKSKLPGPEALNNRGKKDQQVIMIRTATAVEAHQWDERSGQWIKIGEVVDAVGSSRKQLYEGKEYDYVFDIDIEDGAPPLKLPFNASGT